MKINGQVGRKYEVWRKMNRYFCIRSVPVKNSQKHCFTTRFFPRITRLWVNYEQSQS